MDQDSPLEVLYANCREHKTSVMIPVHLIKAQAQGNSLTEHYQRFCHRFSSKTVVLLDEVDLMSFKDKRREILYLLSRSQNPYIS